MLRNFQVIFAGCVCEGCFADAFLGVTEKVRRSEVCAEWQLDVDNCWVDTGLGGWVRWGDWVVLISAEGSNWNDTKWV